MPDKQLYNIRIAEDEQTSVGHRGIGRQLQALSGQNEDQPAVETSGVTAGDYSLDASFAHPYAEKVAAELEELMQATGFDHIPYYTPSDPGRAGDAYVNIDADGSVETASVHDDRIQVVSASLTRSGTRGSHRRTIRVNPESVENVFGTDAVSEIALPASAGKRTWYKRTTKTREAVTVLQTVSTELGDVDLIDARAPSVSPPYDLVYDVPYGDEYQTGVVLWDTRGHSSKTDADGDLQWQKVYQTSHDYRGLAVVDTGRLRITLDTNPEISVEEYDASTGWSTLGLPDKDWTLYDYDITAVTPRKIKAQCIFEHPSQDNYPLNLIARRGRHDVHWLVPSSKSGAPTELQNKLDTIADDAGWRPNGRQGLIKRDRLHY